MDCIHNKEKRPEGFRFSLDLREKAFGTVISDKVYFQIQAGTMKKVSIERKRYILEDVFKVEEVRLRHERFNGEMSDTIRRISLERGDSVAVMVYNLTTNKIILVSQFRYPSYKNGHGWLIETIAGIVDAGESPEASARREVQ